MIEENRMTEPTDEMLDAGRIAYKNRVKQRGITRGDVRAIWNAMAKHIASSSMPYGYTRQDIDDINPDTSLLAK